MASAQLAEPVVARSGASMHSIDDGEFAGQSEENPLDIRSNASIQETPSHMVAQDPFDRVQSGEHGDEPPPPYEEPTIAIVDAPQIAPVEYSCDNSPQLLVPPETSFPAPPPRNPARLSREASDANLTRLPLSPESSSSVHLVPAPLQLRPNQPTGVASPQHSPAPAQPINNAFSSAKAREAGFEIQSPELERRESNNSFPSITMLSSSETLRHTREAGKLKAYLIPFPKPRLKGVKPEDIPDRFLVYTPLPPPLSKPAPGERESHWHKTQRNWQEDVRKATMSNASKATWKGFKAKTTILIGKGVDLTKSSTLEFLDRVSDGAISTAEEAVAEGASGSDAATVPGSPPPGETIPRKPLRKTSTSSTLDKERRPKLDLEELTLIYPPTLSLLPEQIRTEFVNSLFRTRDKSRKDAIIASSLLPVAAAIDATLLITFGGLTEVSGVWAYTSIKGSVTSKRMTRGLSRHEKQQQEQCAQQQDVEVRGCTCGHHEDDFGSPTITPKEEPKKKGKSKKKGIDLRMQQSNHLEILRRYLDLACLKKDFNMFPTIEEMAGDVNEAAVLEAIGWQPTTRQGRDLEMEFKDKVEKLTPEEDEQWQTKEAREDVRRIMKKGAAEWVQWCKNFQKDPAAAMKR